MLSIYNSVKNDKRKSSFAVLNPFGDAAFHHRYNRVSSPVVSSRGHYQPTRKRHKPN